MAWKSMNFDWNRARAFLVAAEEGSLSAAARALETTQPTIGRQIAALERELGVTLFERMAHGLELTESGLQLLASVRLMGQSATEFSLRASGQSQQLEGRVCISASELHAIHYLPPIVAKLRAQEPGIEIDIQSSNSVSDLKQRDADIALRNFRPNQPDLIIRKLRDENIWLYATQSYLENFPAFAAAADLSGLQIIGYEQTESMLSLVKTMGFPVTLKNLAMTSPSYLIQMSLIKQGLGVGMMPASNGDAEPSLVRAFEHLGTLIEIPLWLVVHRELHTSLRVRRVFDLLVTEIGP
ncbi:LysR family transcriptional regulator [Reinekea sp.]|uniref:LysR family transcriptional regulator n=1 Tax=Reinekea sp. TaxID=1970455 RepID=UPI002A82DEF2|nr:LysR family transcriptional regulator [Reinekea sp.]